MSRSPELWLEARAEMHRLETSSDPLEAAAEYCRRYPRHPPDALSDTRRKRRAMTRRAFADGHGWASRLALSLDQPALFTLHAAHLGLSAADSDPAAIFDAGTIARWKAALKKHFRGSLYFRLEASNRLHVHVIADIQDGLAGLPRGGEVVKAVYDFEGLVSYLAKPALPYTAEGLHTWLEAKRTLRRLPRLSGTMNLPRNLPIPNASGLRVSNCPAPSEPSPNPPESRGEIPQLSLEPTGGFRQSDLESTVENPQFNRRKPTGDFPQSDREATSEFPKSEPEPTGQSAQIDRRESTWQIAKLDAPEPTGTLFQFIIISGSAAAPREQPVRRRQAQSYRVRHTERPSARAPP